MKAIVDEGVPLPLVRALSELGCDVAAFPKNWKGLKNGRLMLQVESAGFECLVTCDKNFRYQQNIRRWPVSLIVLPSPFFRDIAPLVEVIAHAVVIAKAGRIIEIQMDGSHSVETNL